MNVLLTGATGFIGQSLIARLIELNHTVAALVREKSLVLAKDVKQIIGVDFSRLSEKGSAALFENKLKKNLKDVNIVIHMAARVHVMADNSNDPLAEFRAVNRDATLLIARMAADAGVKRFIFISTVKVNGEVTELKKPFKSEDQHVPKDPYGLSKYEAEQGLLALAKETGMEVVIIRPPLVYGPGVKANFASLMRLVGKGLPLPFRAITNNKRSLVSVYNLIDLIEVCLDHPNAANQIFLVSDDDDLSTARMVALMAKVQGKIDLSLPVPTCGFKLVGKLLGKTEVVDRLIGSLQLDIEHTKSTLAWTPPYSVEHGFKLAVKK